MIQPLLGEQTDSGGVASRRPEIGCDEDGQEIVVSTSVSEDGPSEPAPRETRTKLDWTNLPPNDQSAVLEVLVNLCQQAVHRFCNENDLFGLRYEHLIFGSSPGAKSVDRIFATTFSLTHWMQKLDFICRTQVLQLQRPNQAPDLGGFIAEVMAHAEKLTIAAESGFDLDRSQALGCVDDALAICDRFKAWKFSRQVRIIRTAIEQDEIKLPELLKLRSDWIPVDWKPVDASREEPRKRRR
jgi:hypothetical protein